MRAAVITGAGVQFRHAAAPTPRPGQVLIRVHAAGLNASDRSSAHKRQAPPIHARSRNAIQAPADAALFGGEAAGEVVAVGSPTERNLLGRRVVALCRAAMAEFAIAWADQLIAIPSELSWTDAASFAVPFVTAHDAACTTGRLRQGDSVMVVGATSTVGIAAIQIAGRTGAARVIAVSRRAARLQQLRHAGIEFDVGLSSEDDPDGWAAQLPPESVDLVIDLVGGALFATCLDARPSAAAWCRWGGSAGPRSR